MRVSPGMAAGFVAGVAIAGGALIWLRVQENVTRDRDAAHVAELDAQVQRLEQTVARLSDEVMSNRHITQLLPAVMPANARVSPQPEAKQALSAAEAHPMVDPALQYRTIRVKP